MEDAELPIITIAVNGLLYPRKLLDYKEERKACLQWLLSVGKDPEHYEVLAARTEESLDWAVIEFER